MLFSCKEDVPHNVGIGTDVPDQSVNGLTMTYSSNNKVRYIIRTAQVRSFTTNQERPYNEFPRGGYIETYNDSTLLETTIFAKYAIQHQKPTEIWMATDSVIVHNLIKNQWLLTDTIFWDIEKKELYTHRPVRIITPDMTLNPQGGMRSDDRFRNYEFYEIRNSELFYKSDKFGKKDSIP